MKQITLLLSLLVSLNSYADITVTSTEKWTEIKKAILTEKSPEKVLLVFDIDKTLLHFTKECEEKNFFRKVFNCQTEPTEKRVPSYIKKFQELGFPTMALTARSLKLSKITAQNLENNNYSFLNRPFPSDLNSIFFAEDYPQFQLNQKTPVQFEDGVALAGSTGKDQVLRLILAHAELSFKKVYFVDDNSDNVVDLIDGFHNDAQTLVHFFYYTKHLSAKKKNKGTKKINQRLSELK